MRYSSWSRSFASSSTRSVTPSGRIAHHVVFVNPSSGARHMTPSWAQTTRRTAQSLSSVISGRRGNAATCRMKSPLTSVRWRSNGVAAVTNPGPSLASSTTTTCFGSSCNATPKARARSGPVNRRGSRISSQIITASLVNVGIRNDRVGAPVALCRASQGLPLLAPKDQTHYTPRAPERPPVRVVPSRRRPRDRASHSLPADTGAH